MSIDLTWPPLPETLPKALLNHLNEHLKTSQRPSFIGPIEITSLEFGDASPNVELIDMRDIYRDFLEDEEDEGEGEGDDDTKKRTQQTSNGAELGEEEDDDDDDEDFEWISRRAATAPQHTQPNSAPPGESSFAYEHLPPHVRMGYGHSPATMDLWSTAPFSPAPGGIMDFSRPVYSPIYRSPSVPLKGPSPPDLDRAPQKQPPAEETDGKPSVDSSREEEEDPTTSNPQHSNPHPNLQLHFSVHWESTLRLSLTTSLLINYPSPGFMSLPIKLSVTGLVFEGEVVVAYEGDPETATTHRHPSRDNSEEKKKKKGRRIHICIMDDQDPYAPAAKKHSVPPPTDTSPTTPPPIPEPMMDPSGDFYGAGPAMMMMSASSSSTTKPPVGTRILPEIFIESEIGQADKHVLKNVTRVERFIQDAIRKTIEEELVWPNFWTGVLGE